MDFESHFAFERATPEYVFEVMQSLFGEAVYDTESTPGRRLEPTTTINDWVDSWDVDDAIFGYPTYVEQLNRWWGVDIPCDEWQPLLQRSDQHTLRDLCELIAHYAYRPIVRPATVLGRSCGPAGAFLALRSFLKEEGLNVTKLAPSTPLAPFTRRHLGPLDRLLRKLVPALPSPRIDDSNFGRRAESGVLFGIGFLYLSLALIHGNAWAAWMGYLLLAGLVIVVGSLFAASFGSSMLPAGVTYGELRTFRDLANLIAANGDQKS